MLGAELRESGPGAARRRADPTRKVSRAGRHGAGPRVPGAGRGGALSGTRSRGGVLQFAVGLMVSPGLGSSGGQRQDG